MRRDGSGSAFGSGFAWVGIHVAFSESYSIPANQADDPVGFHVSAARSVGTDSQDAQAQRSRGHGSSEGLPYMKTVAARLWSYVRPYGWALGVSLVLVAVVGALEALTPFLIGLIFDTLLRGTSAPSVTIPLLAQRFDVPDVDGRTFLALLVGVTVVKTSAEYGSIAAIAYLG